VTTAMLTPSPPLQAAPWGVEGKVGATCVKPVDSNSGVGDCHCAAQNPP